MPDAAVTLAATEPFAGLTLPAAPGLSCRAIGAEARFSLRLRPEHRHHVAEALSVEVPDTVGAVAEAGGLAVLCLGPDDWRILADPAEAGRLAAAIAALPVSHALVDVGAREVAFELEGPLVEAVLVADCPLDLSLEAFRVGRATRTLYGKVGIVLWRRRDDRFRLDCGRSFAGHLVARLGLAAAEAAALARHRAGLRR